MAFPEIIGKTGVTVQGKKRRWNSATGLVEIHTEKGPVAASDARFTEMITVAGNTPAYDTVEYDPGKGVGTLTATVSLEQGGGGLPGVGDPVATYELLPNMIMKPLEQSWYYAIDGTPLTGAQIRTARKAFDEAMYLPNATPSDATWTTKLKAFYTDLCFGIEELPEPAFVLRETKTVSRRCTSAKLSYTDCLRVVTLPNITAVNILIDIAQITAGEWLKQLPTCRTNGKRNLDLVQEWWWAYKWSARHYGGTWSPA